MKSSTSQTPSWFNYSAGNVGVIRVQGALIANGTATNPIIFTRDNTGFWGTILIDQNANETSSCSNCIIEFAKEIRNVTGIPAIVSFNGGLSVYKSFISLNQNEIRNNNINGLYIREVENAFSFSNNKFYDNGTNGTLIELSAVNAINNTYYNNSISASGQVSAVRSSGSSVYFVGNLIYNNDDFGIYTSNGGNNHIVNNTIFGNSQGIRVEGGANTFIYNSIVQNNTINFATSNVGGAIIEMQYSLTNDSVFPTNIANISNNILSSNAIFTNSDLNNFSLQATSPAINSGSPATEGLNIPTLDSQGNPRISNGIIDMGALEFQQPIASFTLFTASNPTVGGSTSGGGTFVNGTSVSVSGVANEGYGFLNWSENGNIVSDLENFSFALTSNRTLVANFEIILSTEQPEINENLVVIYPNPTTDFINIDADEFTSIEIYDIFGRLILSSATHKIDLRSQPLGVYVLKIKFSNGLEQTKRIIRQ